MTNKELFIKTYNAHLDFEQAVGLMLLAGVQTDESKFSNAFYAIFDAVMSIVLTEEGQQYFYEEILYEDYFLEEVLDALENYFVEK